MGQTILSGIFNKNSETDIQIPATESNNSSKSSITYFENVSDRIIYEIFDFLDFYHIYEAFYNLNIRFRNLLTDSTLPIKLNLSCIPKANFYRFYTQIFIPYQHRIKSLHSSNIFISQMIFSQFSIISNFTQLEKLVLINVESEQLEELLHYLIVLTHLSSLTINCEYNIPNKNNYYPQLLRLPALKYCNVLLKDYRDDELLSITMNEFSPIEHLVIKNISYIEEINIILPYVPQLRRLSLYHLCKLNSKPIKFNSTMLNCLTYVDLNIIDITFDEFILMIKNLFPKLEELHISMRNNKTYLSAHRWERLIRNYMPYLRIFDIHISEYLFCLEDIRKYIPLFNQFRTPFWIERKWFFGHHIYQNKNQDELHSGHFIIFYSTNPYKRKNYILCGERHGNIGSNDRQNRLESVNHVEIQDDGSIMNCVKYFPNATELTLCSFDQGQRFPSTTLIRTMPLTQLTKLVIDYNYIFFAHIIELLSYTPNIHTFTINRGLFDEQDIVLRQQSEAFQLVSNTNNIKTLNIISGCSVLGVNFLINLCPRLQHITIKNCRYSLVPILQLLWSQDNDNIRHLHSLCLHGLEQDLETIDTLLKSKKSLDVSSIRIGELTLSRIYLWW